MPLRDYLSNAWDHIQANLFPWLAEEIGPLTETHKQVITVLEMARVEALVQSWPGLPGRPPTADQHADRAAYGRQAIAAPLRLGAPRRDAE